MKPTIVVYCCANSCGNPEETVEKCNSDGGADIRMVRLPCSGRSDVLHIVHAIEDGADMAMIAGCPEGACRYLQGNIKARQRVKFANKVLSEAGLGNERVAMVNLDPEKGGDFAAALSAVIAKAAELGPWLKK